MADLVHDDILDQLADQLLGQLGLGVGLDRVGHDERRQAQLGLHPGGEPARGPLAVGQPLEQLAADAGPLGRDDRQLAVAQVSEAGVDLAEAALDRQGRADDLAQRRDRAGAIGDGRVAGQHGVLVLPGLDPGGVEDDVAVDDLAGHRVRAEPRHGVGLVGGDPAEGAVVDVFGVELVTRRLLPADGHGVAVADLLERLVPLADPVLDERAVLGGDGILDVPDDLLPRGRKLGPGIGLLQPPAVDVAGIHVIRVGDAEIFGRIEEVANPIVGGPGPVPHVGGLHDAVVEDDRHATLVDHAFGPLAHPLAAEGRLHFQLQVVGEGLDLVPGGPAPVEVAERKLGEVGEEDIRQVDHHAHPAAGVEADDRQGHQDRVGIVLPHRLLDRRAHGRLDVDVLADELDLVAHPMEHDHPLVAEVQRVAGHRQSSGDGDRHQQRRIELERLDLGVEMFILLEQRVKTVVTGRPRRDLGEVPVFGRVVRVRPHARAAHQSRPERIQVEVGGLAFGRRGDGGGGGRLVVAPGRGDRGEDQSGR